jgi:putrescine aminotransferase
MPPVNFDYLFDPNPSDETRERILAETFTRYHENLNPGFITLKRSVKHDSYGVEWRGDGMYMYDIHGNRFIDCLAGYGVFALGHRHPHVIKRVQQTFERIGMYSQELLNPLQATLAYEIAQRAPAGLKYVYYHSGGAESNDAALKVARQSTGRISHTHFSNSFHGKTLGALSLTDRWGIRKPFEPLLGGIRKAPYNNVELLPDYVTDETASAVVEVVQGEGGIRSATPQFLAALRARCDEVGALLHVDEVQSGWGRSGRFFCSEHFGLVPDIITMGKAMGGGIMPISALIANQRAFGRLAENPWWLSNTFAGSQPACAAGLAAIEVYEQEDLLAQCREKGEYLLGQLRQVVADHLGLLIEARGLGLWVGLECGTPELGTQLADELFKRNVLVGQTINNPSTLRFQPPLIITREEMDTVVAAVAESVKSISPVRMPEPAAAGTD